MKKLAALLCVVFYATFSFADDIVHDVVTPQPGVTGQATTQATYFPVDLKVRVTNNGVPVAFAQVNFIASNGAVFFVSPNFTFSGHHETATDAQGYAIASNLIGFQPGPTTLTVTTVGTREGSVSFPMTVLPGGPARYEVVSGSKQKATVGTTYPQPWIAQAFDAAGHVVPNAAVLFVADTDPTLPSGTFNGSSSVFVRADSNGIAISPPFTANLVAGKEEGSAMALSSSPVQAAFFGFTNLAASGGGSGGGGSGDGCGAQNKGKGNCGNGNGANHGK